MWYLLNLVHLYDITIIISRYINPGLVHPRGWVFKIKKYIRLNPNSDVTDAEHAKNRIVGIQVTSLQELYISKRHLCCFLLLKMIFKYISTTKGNNYVGRIWLCLYQWRIAGWQKGWLKKKKKKKTTRSGYFESYFIFSLSFTAIAYDPILFFLSSS